MKLNKVWRIENPPKNPKLILQTNINHKPCCSFFVSLWSQAIHRCISSELGDRFEVRSSSRNAVSVAGVDVLRVAYAGSVGPSFWRRGNHLLPAVPYTKGWRYWNQFVALLGGDGG